MTSSRSAWVRRSILLLVGAGLALRLLTEPTLTTLAQPVLTLEPTTWNVIGLDSNDVTAGPDTFPVGARACNTGDADATNLLASFVWDTPSLFITISGSSTLTLASLAPGECAEFVFYVTVSRSILAYDATALFHITLSADGLPTLSTPTPRALYVERLVSQNRNGTTLISVDGTPITFGSTITLAIGDTYTFEIEGFTATGGYEQLESFFTFNNTMFEILSVSVAYAEPPGATNDQVYADACGWDNNPTSLTYRSCIGPVNYTGGKAGGDPIITTYVVRVIGTGTATLQNLIYDFSGSSYHYNSDFDDIIITVIAAEPTPTPTQTPTSTPTDTPTPTPTFTDTPTATDTPTSTPTHTPTDTPTPTPTFTDTPTATDTPTSTDTPTATPTFTDTPTPTDTPVATATPTSTDTPVPTPTPTGPVVALIDPALTKTGDPPTAQVGDTVVFTIAVFNNGTADALGVVVTDTFPAFLDIVSVSVAPAGPAVTIAGNTVTIDLGTVTPSDLYTVDVTTVVNVLGLPPGGTNEASLVSLSSDVDLTNNVDDFFLIIDASGLPLPESGFSPGRPSRVPPQPKGLGYRAYDDLWLELPGRPGPIPIVGVPVTADGWDVTWLGNDAGYLNGTAFPTWRGNSGIAGHIVLANGLPGPFARLRGLQYGDPVIVRAWGLRHVYEVREVAHVSPRDPFVLRHEDLSWLTLITCEGYVEETDTYQGRVAVRAVLVSVGLDDPLPPVKTDPGRLEPV